MKNFTKQNFKTNPLWIRLLVMTFMLLVGTSSAWGANLSSGQFIQFKFSQGSVSQSSGWNGTVLNMWDNNGNSKQVNVQPGEVYTISEGHWIPTKFQYLSQYDYSGWKGKTAEIGDCGGEASLQPNTCYFVTLKTSTNWTGESYKNYPNKEFQHSLSCTTVDPCETTFVVAGSSGLANGEDWNQNSKKNVMTCNQGIYTITFNNVTAGNYEYKVVEQGNWNVAYPGSNKPISFDSNSNVTITFNSLTKEVSHDVTDACTTINDLDITASKTSICDGESVTLTLNNKQSGVTYKIGNTTIFNSSDAKPTYNTGAITGVSSKSYTIKATANNQCALKEETVTVTVNDLPAAPSNLGSATICVGEETILPTVTGSWYTDANTTTPLPSREVNPAETTSYFATSKSKNCESSSRTEYVVTVKSLADANNYELTNTTADYTGTKVTLQPRDVTVKNNAAAVSSIYFKQDAINVGTYKVYVTTEANNTYCAATDLEIGEFTINCKAPTEVDFVYTGANVTYDGNAQAQTVTWANNDDKGGAITVWYKSGSEYTQTAPTNAGVYTVAVTSAAAGNYCAQEQKIEKGTLTIKCAKITDVENNFVLSSTSYNYGEPAKPTVSLKQNSTLVQPGLGAITTKYYNSSDQEVTNPTAVGTYTAKISIAAGTGYCALDETAVGNFTITCPVPAKVPTLSKTDVQKCNGVTGTKGTITITNYSTDYNGGNGYKFLLGDSFEPTIGNDGVMGEIDFVGDAETYKVQVATVCGSSISQYVNSTIQVNAINTVPTISLDPTSAPVCEGATFANITDYVTVNTNDKVNWYEQASGGTALEEREAIKVTTYYAEASIGDCKSERAQFEVSSIMKAPTVPEISASKNLICKGESVDITLVSREDGVTYTMNSSTVFIEDETYNTGALNENTSFILTATNSCGSTNSAELAIAVDKSPTFTAPTAIQTNKEVTLTSAAGASTQWSVTPTENVTLTDNDDGTATFVATANGDYTITASNGVCAQVSHTIKVSDAFYIWVRNAKESDTAYGQFYFPNENSEAVRGGEMFYAECDARPTQDNYKSYNEGGRKADVVQNDCDGYTWYGFKASEEVISGTKYFYVHATNDISNGGYFTHSVPLKVTMSADLYYTLGENGNSYWGWNLATASAPYAGPKVHASGSTTLGTNKFAALYVTDCSGKEVTIYQWEYSSTKNGTYNPYSASVSNSGTLYSGDAGTTNNIRPSEAGWYRCKVTYDDASATSEAVQVTGTYSHESGSLPVFVVNTNGEGFPVNDCSGTPSKNADKMKAKVSVDVKIYQDGTMVYDRKARMNYRGSSSLNFLKKSYAFCPGKANCVEDKGRQDYVKTEKMNMLNVGSAEDKDWVLYAAAPDPSLMRNRLVFDTYKEMTGKWGVSSRFVKLYVDGTYKGIYVLMDKITNNKKRVDITHADGFIVKFDKTDKADRVGGYEGVLGDEKTFKTTRTGADNLGSYDTSIDQRFEIEYPEKDDYPTGWSAKVNSIKAMFEGFENALEAKDFATVQKYIDYDSWADWFIISEYAKNVDAYRASCIFVYNGDKIEATPLWDQELSFNNQTMVNHGNNDATGLLVTRSSIYEDTFKAPFWFTNKGTDIDNITGGLLSDPCFVQVVKEKWNQYSTGTGPLTADALNTKIGAYTTELGSATDIVFNRNTMDCGSCDNGGCYNGDTGYNGSIQKSSSIEAMTETWFKYRGNNLTTAINKLKGANFSIQILPSEVKTTPWEQAHIAVNVSPEGYHYVLEYTDNNLGGVPNVIIEENGNEMTYRIPRPASWSTGDEDTEGERADIEYGIKATLNVASGTIVCGSQAAPTSTAKIILQDEPNEKCD